MRDKSFYFTYNVLDYKRANVGRNAFWLIMSFAATVVCSSSNWSPCSCITYTHGVILFIAPTNMHTQCIIYVCIYCIRTRIIIRVRLGVISLQNSQSEMFHSTSKSLTFPFASCTRLSTVVAVLRAFIFTYLYTTFKLTQTHTSL